MLDELLIWSIVPNVFSLGDASSLPTSKTAAAITAQAPVLARNLSDTMLGKTSLVAKYDGYTSCPVRPDASITCCNLTSHLAIDWKRRTPAC